MTTPGGDSGRHCLQCDYNLTGVTSDRCPECGWEIDDPLIEIARRRPTHDVWRLPVSLLCCVVGVAALFLTLTPGGWSQFVLQRPRSTPSMPMMMFIACSAVCGLIHVVMGVGIVPFGRTWAINVNRLVVVFCLAAAAQILSALVAVLMSSQASTGGVIGFVVIFGFASAVGWVLLLVSAMTFHSKQEALRSLRAYQSRRTPGEPDGAPFVVVVAGKFRSGEVRVEACSVRRDTNPTLEAAIEEAWRARLAVAAERGQYLYNGEVGRLVGADVHDGVLQLRISPVSYREFIGTNLFNAPLHAVMGDAGFANPLGTSALIITSDGCLLMGRRSDRVSFHAGYLHSFGGMLEPHDRVADGTYDVFAAVRREVREELRLTDDEIADVWCTGLVRDGHMHQPELVFDVRLRLGRREVLSRFSAATDEEHTAIESCHDLPEAIVPFIRAGAPVVPVAIGALMLHGRAAWGREWYENHSYLLFGDLPAAGRISRIERDPAVD